MPCHVVPQLERHAHLGNSAVAGAPMPRLLVLRFACATACAFHFCMRRRVAARVRHCNADDGALRHAIVCCTSSHSAPPTTRSTSPSPGEVLTAINARSARRTPLTLNASNPKPANTTTTTTLRKFITQPSQYKLAAFIHACFQLWNRHPSAHTNLLSRTIGSQSVKNQPTHEPSPTGSCDICPSPPVITLGK